MTKLDYKKTNERCVHTLQLIMEEGNVKGNPINIMMNRNLRFFERLARKNRFISDEDLPRLKDDITKL